MRLEQVDLNLFVVFEAIYTERNLTRAAEILHVTQPAISNALGRLRRVYEDELFVRHPRGMLPTPVAENIIGQVRQALELFSSSLQEGATFDPQRSEKTFVLSMNDLAEMLVLPQLLQQVRALAPKVSVHNFYIGRDALVRELSAGQVDLAIDVPLVNDANVLHTPVSAEAYVCMLRRGHPMLKRPMTLEDYLSLDHVHVSSRRTGGGYVDFALSKLGHKRHIAIRLQHYFAAPNIIRESDMALTVPRTLANRVDLPCVEVPFLLESLDWHLYWHRSADSDSANRWMRGLIASLLSS